MSKKAVGKEDIRSTPHYKHMTSFLLNTDIIIGHNITLWDIPVLERLLGIKYEGKIVDTLMLSWYLFPNRNTHGLEDWGRDLGFPKPKIDDWEGLSYEEYLHRCESDVEINSLLWDKIWKYLIDLYGSEQEAWRLIDYLSFKMDCAREQERSRWKLDVKHVEDNLESLCKARDSKVGQLVGAMPMVAKTASRKPPAKPFKQDGDMSSTGLRWKILTENLNLPFEHNAIIKERVGWDNPKPSSHQQVKDWLFSLGWHPENFKHKREDDGSFRKIPQVKSADEDGEVCNSVKKLFQVEPKLELLNGLGILNHRIGILEGFLKSVDEDGYVKARIGGLTNTMRFKHREVVNLPGVDKQYGDVVRGSLIAPDGYELCGSDMCALEDMTKRHYMWDYDPEYVTEMSSEGYDPHLDIGILAGMITQGESDAYKMGNKTSVISKLRHDAKQVNYSCTYGVTPAGLVRNTGMALGKCTKLHKTYWDRNWSIKAIADDCVVKPVNGQNWLFNPVSNLWYTLRSHKDRFSTLNQGTGVFCFDTWIKIIRAKRKQLTGQFHDEIIACLKLGNRERYTKILKEAIQETNVQLNLNVELDVDVSFGNTYGEIH